MKTFSRTRLVYVVALQNQIQYNLLKTVQEEQDPGPIDPATEEMISTLKQVEELTERLKKLVEFYLKPTTTV